MSAVKLRLNTGEDVNVGVTTDEAVLRRYFALLDVASDAAESKQTIPRNMIVVWETGEELGLWTIIENKEEPFVKGRVY